MEQQQQIRLTQAETRERQKKAQLQASYLAVAENEHRADPVIKEVREDLSEIVKQLEECNELQRKLSVAQIDKKKQLNALLTPYLPEELRAI